MINIAIDGPSGAGKSTIAKAIAKELNIIYLDTGAMYRAVALKAQSLGIDPLDNEKVDKMLPSVNIAIEYIDDTQHIFLDGKDVSEDIRKHEVSQMASDISKNHNVRMFLVEMQRKIAKENNVIMDGRDTTSFVLPNANYKFYLTASAEERTKRRVLQLEEKGEVVDFDIMLADIVARDNNDMTRDFAPLLQTEDSILIDSTDMTKDEVIEKILGIVK